MLCELFGDAGRVRPSLVLGQAPEVVGEVTCRRLVLHHLPFEGDVVEALHRGLVPCLHPVELVEKAVVHLARGSDHLLDTMGLDRRGTLIAIKEKVVSELGVLGGLRPRPRVAPRINGELRRSRRTGSAPRANVLGAHPLLLVSTGSSAA